ncbi:MAG: acetate--CoA ligase family protein [Spirochaetes bacterium]|nr:acetate--CoA ligase family protein [Spirochaetota bacterium]
MKTEVDPIRALFEPASIAVIGASQDRKKIGFTIVKNLVSGGYRGTIYPVNPSGGEIFDLKAYRSLGEIDGPIDAASIAIPAKLVVEAVRQCAAKGVRNVQIITSGFSEVGNHSDENTIAAIARETGMRVLGPNIFGLYSSSASMNATFSASAISPGSVAILTQSGALGIAMIGRTAVENIGLSAIVSTGNKCDIDETDLLGYLVDHEATKAILMYIEGVKNGDRLIPMLKRVTLRKPVVVIKSGRSKRGAMAAASHTGSLAGADNIFDAVMRQCGVLRAESIDEAFNWCKFLSASPRPKEMRAVIVTNGGGIGVMATDACEKYGIELYDDQNVLKEVFSPATPPFGSTKNPVDITGGAMAEDYDLALSAPATSEHMDATIALYCETATFDSENLSPMIRETYNRHMSAGKPVTYAVVGGESVEKTLMELRRENLPVYGDVYQAVSCLGSAFKYYSFRDEFSDSTDIAEIDAARINGIIDSVQSQGRSFLLADEGREVMEAAGISVPRSRVARSLKDAIRASGELTNPLVMKVVSRDIIHKSDAGGIALNLENADEVMDAYGAILHNCRSYDPNAVIDGVELAEMAPQGIELVIGAVRDVSYGPIVMCGLGGVYVEVMKDVSFRSFPMGRQDAMSMLQEIRSYPLLLGVRGEKRKDIDGVIDMIIKLGSILIRCDRISDIEINPVRVYDSEKGLRALDVRILLKTIQGGSSHE